MFRCGSIPVVGYTSANTYYIDLKAVLPNQITTLAKAIKEREEMEVTKFDTCKTAPDEVKVRNPAFDVTPNSLVTGLITEKCIINSPFNENLHKEYN